MTWLIRLYPPAWRRRYGRELAELISSQPASLGMALDLVAAAVDAWLNPQSSTAAAAADAKGTGAMVPERLRLRSTGHGPNVTAADGRKATMVIVGGTLALTLAFVWAMAGHPKNPYLESLLAVSWLVPTVFSQHFTTLKGRPVRVQAVLIGGQTAFVIAIAVAAAWIGSSVHNWRGFASRVTAPGSPAPGSSGRVVPRFWPSLGRADARGLGCPCFAAGGEVSSLVSVVVVASGQPRLVAVHHDKHNAIGAAQRRTAVPEVPPTSWRRAAYRRWRAEVHL